MVESADIRQWVSDDEDWTEGEAYFDYDDPDTPGGTDSYCVMICLRSRVEGPRGGVVPALMAEIIAPTWVGVCRAFRDLGLPRPSAEHARVKER